MSVPMVIHQVAHTPQLAEEYLAQRMADLGNDGLAGSGTGARPIKPGKPNSAGRLAQPGQEERVDLGGTFEV